MAAPALTVIGGEARSCPLRPAGLVLACAILVVAGCATRGVPPRSGTPPRAAAPGVPRPAATTEPGAASRPPAVTTPIPGAAPRPADQPPPVIVALLDESEASRSSGDLEGAVSTLERAVRIQPRNPRLWQALAKVRLQQGEAALAEELARKSSVLAAGDEALIAENQRVIAAARQHQGSAPSDPETGDD